MMRSTIVRQEVAIGAFLVGAALLVAVGGVLKTRERGLIDAVFTRRPWRRRGVARALIARTLVLLRDRGMTSAYLGVDGLNPNQAATLYTSLGFEIATTTYDWTKPLPAGGDGGMTKETGG